MAMPPATECRCGTLSAAAAPEQAGTHWLQAHRVPSQQKIRPGSSFDDLISTGEDCRRDRQAERVSRFEVDHQIKSLFLPASASYTSRSSGASRAPGFLHCFQQLRQFREGFSYKVAGVLHYPLDAIKRGSLNQRGDQLGVCFRVARAESFIDRIASSRFWCTVGIIPHRSFSSWLGIVAGDAGRAVTAEEAVGAA